MVLFVELNAVSSLSPSPNPLSLIHSNLMAAVSLLPDPPKVGHAHTVSDWLHLLNLPYLEEKFRGYSLKRVSNFWDIELASVSSPLVLCSDHVMYHMTHQ